MFCTLPKDISELKGATDMTWRTSLKVRQLAKFDTKCPPLKEVYGMKCTWKPHDDKHICEEHNKPPTAVFEPWGKMLNKTQKCHMKILNLKDQNAMTMCHDNVKQCT